MIDKVTFNLNMIGPFVKDKAFSNKDNSLIIIAYRQMHYIHDTKSCRKDYSHSISIVSISQYLTLAVEQEMPYCFQEC